MKRYSRIVEMLAGVMLILSLWAVQVDKSSTWQFTFLAVSVILIGFSGYFRFLKRKE